MKCKKCGNDTFIAHQLCRMDIMVDESGEFLRNLAGGAEMNIYDAEHPYGPFTCSKCGAQYDELTDTPNTEEQTEPAYAVFNITRIRACENEYWCNRIYMKLPADDKQDWATILKDKNRAKELLVNRIQKRLATLGGWKSICFASMDYNWGDYIMDLPFSEYGLFGEDDMNIPKNIVAIIDLVVNQDELLAPENVSAELLFFDDHDKCFHKTPCSIDFQDGTIDTDNDESEAIEQAVRASIRIGEEFIPCDPSEDFMQLCVTNDMTAHHPDI